VKEGLRASGNPWKQVTGTALVETFPAAFTSTGRKTDAWRVQSPPALVTVVTVNMLALLLLR
jgi:hypothetical protein